MALTPEQAAELLASRDGKQRRPTDLTPEQRKRKIAAQNTAGHAARKALQDLHPDEYAVLYRVAFDKAMAK